MNCNSEKIPQYLHWNDRPLFADNDFLPEHNLYRVGNPIEFPSVTTALSCKWSFLIQEEDVLRADDPPLGDDFRYAKVRELRSFFLPPREKLEGENLGWHKLSCIFLHKPNACDYSHCEILIRHQIFENQDAINLREEHIWTYQSWIDKQTLLQKKGSFYGNMRKDYRVEIIKLFCYPE